MTTISQTGPRAAKPQARGHESQSPEKRHIEAVNLEILCRENLREKAGRPARVEDDFAEDDLALHSLLESELAGPLVPSLEPNEMVRVTKLRKTFVLHLSGPTVLNALDDVSLSLNKGECLAITGPSGAGKSSLLRCIYGNYLITSGEILIRDGQATVAINLATPRDIMGLRFRAISYVSQFLRVIPRVSALEVVAEPLIERGQTKSEARREASELLSRLRVPKRLQELPPATFSGGERQRVNIARGLIWPSPILLLDEPTASLDPANKKVALDLINEAKARGAAIIGVFHDREALEAVSDKVYKTRPKKENGTKKSQATKTEDRSIKVNGTPGAPMGTEEIE